MGLFKKRTREDKTAEKSSKPGRLFAGLSKTRAILTADLGELISGRKAIDAEVLEELETRLLMADLGVETTDAVLEALRRKIEFGEVRNAENLLIHLSALLKARLQFDAPSSMPSADARPYTVLVIGVNGSGKTTSIGKLAKYYQNAGHSVMLAAGDTFRAAAVEQLQTWGERNQVPVIAQADGADSAAVAFDALQAAQSRGTDVLLIDTAGRLHTHSGLMDELKKIKRVLGKQDPGIPQQVLLVLDAGIGQNALQQAKQFHEAIGVTGLVLTKLDGTAKGGILFAIRDKLEMPVQFIGVGEGMEDLREFDADQFVDALLAQDS